MPGFAKLGCCQAADFVRANTAYPKDPDTQDFLTSRCEEIRLSCC